MADIAKAKRNVSRMIDGGASEQEIDSYLASEGLSAEALRGGGGSQGPMRAIGGAASQFNKMIPFADEVAAGFGVAKDIATGKVGMKPGPNMNVFDPEAIVESWKRNRADQSVVAGDFDTEHPNMAALARGTGMVASSAVPMGRIAAGGTTLGNAARGAVMAGNQGALTAFADEGDFGDRLGAASRASVDPVTLGLGAAIGARANTPGRSGKPVSVDELQALKRQAYQDVDNMGVSYGQGDYDTLIAEIEDAARKSRLVKGVAPKGSRTLRNFKSDPYVDPTLSDIEQMRQIVNRNIPIKEDGADKVFGNLMRDKLDDFIASTDPVGGQSAQDAIGAVNNARRLNARYRKTEAVSDAIKAAEENVGASGGNIDNALRQQLKNVYRKQRGLTPEEERAFEKVIQGSKTQNLLRTVGRLAPQNGISMAMSIGGTAVNPAYASVPVIGALARGAAEHSTKKNVDQLLRIISQGPRNIDPVTEALRGLLTSKVIQASANKSNKKKEKK
jgi:hypothetical protein